MQPSSIPDNVFDVRISGPRRELHSFGEKAVHNRLRHLVVIPVLDPIAQNQNHSRAINGLPRKSTVGQRLIHDNLILAFDRPDRGGITVASVDENLTKTVSLMEDQTARILQAAPIRAKEAYVVSQSGGNRFPDLLMVGPEHKIPVVVEENPGDIIQWVLDAGGRVAGSVIRDSDDAPICRYRAESEAEWEKLTMPKGSIPLFLDAKDDMLFSTHVNEGGASVVSIFSLKEKKLTGKFYGHPEYDIILPDTEYIANQSDGSIVGFIHHTETPNVVQFSDSHIKLQGQVNALLPATLNRVLGYATNGMLVVESESDTLPKTCYFVQLESGSVTPFFPFRPWIETTQTTQMMPVKFSSRDGFDLHGYLTLAPSKTKNKPTPLIVKVHGGPRERVTWGFDPETRFFVRLGYSVLQVNYRGSVGYGRDYVPQSFLDTCRFAVEDVADGVRWAVAQGYIARERVAIFGGGFGAFAALAGAAFEPDLYRGAIGYAGIYDWHLPMSDVDRNVLKKHIRWPGNLRKKANAHRTALRQISPLHASKNIRASVLIFHPGSEAMLFKKQAMSMSRNLKRTGIDYTVAVSTHGIQRHAVAEGDELTTPLRVLFQMAGYTPDELAERPKLLAGRTGSPSRIDGSNVPPIQKEGNRIAFFTTVAEFLEKHLSP